MEWSDRHKNIRDVLSMVYFRDDESVQIVKDSGLKIHKIRWDDNPTIRWHEIVSTAKDTGKLENLVQSALKANPDNLNLKQLKSQNFTPARGRELSFDDWKTDRQNEKIIGNRTDFLPSIFLKIGAEKVKPVGKINVPSMLTVGTGFLIKNDLLVTNSHVLISEEVAESSTVDFNYQRDQNGALMQLDQYQLDPNEYFRIDTSNDIAVVKVKSNPTIKYGFLNVTDSEVSANERVSIIQHPGGLEKQIAVHNNEVTFSDEQAVQYLTDTMPGSSGAPVFNKSWDLVAIHRRGGWITEPGSKKLKFRNEGVPIKHLNQLVGSNVDSK